MHYGHLTITHALRPSHHHPCITPISPSPMHYAHLTITHTSRPSHHHTCITPISPSPMYYVHCAHPIISRKSNVAAIIWFYFPYENKLVLYSVTTGTRAEIAICLVGDSNPVLSSKPLRRWITDVITILFSDTLVVTHLHILLLLRGAPASNFTHSLLLPDVFG